MSGTSCFGCCRHGQSNFPSSSVKDSRKLACGALSSIPIQDALSPEGCIWIVKPSTLIYVRKYVCMYVCMYVYICIYTYVYRQEPEQIANPSS